MQEDTINVIRFSQLQKMLGGISRSTVDRWEKSGKFPARLHIGENSIGWLAEEIYSWIHEKRKNISQ